AVEDGPRGGLDQPGAEPGPAAPKRGFSFRNIGRQLAAVRPEPEDTGDRAVTAPAGMFSRAPVGGDQPAGPGFAGVGDAGSAGGARADDEQAAGPVAGDDAGGAGSTGGDEGQAAGPVAGDDAGGAGST